MLSAGLARLTNQHAFSPSSRWYLRKPVVWVLHLKSKLIVSKNRPFPGVDAQCGLRTCRREIEKKRHNQEPGKDAPASQYELRVPGRRFSLISRPVKFAHGPIVDRGHPSAKLFLCPYGIYTIS